MNVGLDRVEKLRKEGQYWILLNSEWLDPKDEQLPVLKPNMFNMTASYHRGSEIHIPYGQCGERKEKYTFNYNKLAEKKNECLWYVSNCKDSRSKRSDYANELGRYIPVTFRHVRGKCGPEKNLTRTRAFIGLQFNDTVETNSYKFYLSFENTYCKDYMTEKVFRMFQDTIHSVPIVRGSGPYKSVLPPHSYIDTADFKSPKALADYLLILTNNDQLYEEYFESRSKYKVTICTMIMLMNGHVVYVNMFVVCDKTTSYNLLQIQMFQSRQKTVFFQRISTTDQINKMSKLCYSKILLFN